MLCISTKRKQLARFLEFLVIGILMGVAEDLLAIYLTTDEPFTLQVVVVVVLVAISFAAFAAFVVDREDVRPFERTLNGLDVGQATSRRSSK